MPRHLPRRLSSMEPTLSRGTRWMPSTSPSPVPKTRPRPSRYQVHQADMQPFTLPTSHFRTTLPTCLSSRAISTVSIRLTSIQRETSTSISMVLTRTAWTGAMPISPSPGSLSVQHRRASRTAGTRVAISCLQSRPNSTSPRLKVRKQTTMNTISPRRRASSSPTCSDSPA